MQRDTGARISWLYVEIMETSLQAPHMPPHCLKYIMWDKTWRRQWQEDNYRPVFVCNQSQLPAMSRPTLNYEWRQDGSMGTPAQALNKT